MWTRIRGELLRVGRVTAWSLGAASVNFIAGIVLARSLGPAGRGLLSVLVSVAGLASIAAAAGTNVAFRAMLPKSLVNLRGYMKATLVLAVVLAVPLLLIAGLIVAFAVDSSVLSWWNMSFFLFFGLTNLLWLQAKEGLNAVGRVGSAAAVGALGAGVFFGLVILAGVLWPGSYLAVIGAYCLINLVQLMVAGLRLRPFLQPGASFGTRRLLKAGPAYLAYHFGQELTLRLDRTLIGVFSNNAAVGLFSVGAGMAEMMRLPVLASGQYVLLESARDGMSLRAIFRRCGFWMGIVSVGAGALWLLAPLLVSVLYGDEYRGAVLPFRILLLAQILLVPFLISSRALIGLGGRWIASVPSVVGLAVLLSFGVALIPRFGAVGGGISCCAAFMSMSAAAMVSVVAIVRKQNK